MSQSLQSVDQFSRPLGPRTRLKELAMILITGASGLVGGRVLREVVRSGNPVRAMYRSQDHASKASSDVKAVTADFADAESLRRALDGIDTVYVVCSPVPQLVEWEGNMIDACRQAQVKRIVLNSALGAGNYAKSFPSWHAKVEDQLVSSGLSWTILRPNSFMQNVGSHFASTIRSQNAFYSSLGSARMSYIDVRDIAVIAAKVLTMDIHGGKTYELNGPEALSSGEVAAKISRLVGRSVRYVDIPFEAQRKSLLGLGMPEWQVNALLELQEYYTQGNGGQVDGLVEKLLGRPAIRMDQYLAENADSFREQAA
jgi:uncharacterized protein YbjT (DUF2867 family)